ncbi:MAG: NADP-dependent oxidoreductase, partial [archaeon]|nr:NADP-dependent oxidoreductase [archaeon]
KIKGCRVVGIAGSPAKCTYLTGIGCDAAIDYHVPNLSAAIRAACPYGVDQYFDNVGGLIKDAVFESLNPFARVSSCGAISSYNLAHLTPCRNWEWMIITKQIRIEGFISSRWIDSWPVAFADMAQWIRAGKLTFEETFEHGFGSIINAFNKMMQGENTGKMVVVIKPN